MSVIRYIRYIAVQARWKVLGYEIIAGIFMPNVELKLSL